MSTTYVEKNTNSDLTIYNDGSSGTVNVRKVLDITTGTASNITSTIPINSTNKEIFITISSLPNALLWGGGTYTINLNVNQAANRGSFISEVILARISSNGSITRATKSSGAISILVTSTGLKTKTIVWNDGTQNPTGRQATDRLAVIIRITNPSSTNTDSPRYEVGVSANSDTVVVPPPLIGASLSDTLSLSDNIKTVVKYNVINSIPLLDKIQILWKAVLSNNISVIDSLKILAGIKNINTLSLVDRINLLMKNQLSDTLLLSDYIHMGEPRGLEDILILSDFIVGGRPISDALFVVIYVQDALEFNAFVFSELQIRNNILDVLFVKKV